MPRDFIHPLGGFEIAILTWASGPLGGSVTFSMEGWEWFVVQAADVTVDNTLGLAAANAQVMSFGNSLFPMRGLSGITAAAGATQQTFFGLGSASYTTGAGNPNVTSLPWVINPNGYSLRVGFINGDGNTRLGAGSFTLAGLKRSPERKK